MIRNIVVPALLMACCGLIAGCDQAPGTPEEAARVISERINADDLPAADALLRPAINRWPESRGLRELQGDLDLQRGNGTRAQAAYEKAIRSAPGDRGLQLKLARALLVQERFREVMALAEPAADDPDDLAAGFGLLRLEAELSGGSQDFPAHRDTAEALWRLAGTAPDGPGFVAVRRRLERLAPRWEAVEAARQHAQCRPPPGSAPAAKTAAATGQRLRVGAGQELTTPAAAAAVATDGAIVEIEAGTYDEAVVWQQNSLTLRGVSGRPRLRAAGARLAGGATWVLSGRNTVIEKLEFAGGGDAALRLEGAGLTVRESVFRNSATAIRTADGASGEVLITSSEFHDEPAAPARGATSGAWIDIGRVTKATVEFSMLSASGPGPAIRSRARLTGVNYNRMVAGYPSVPASLIDLPEAGAAQILGNELQMPAGAAGSPFIAYGAPDGGGAPSGSTLSVLSNTFYNEAAGRVGVRIQSEARVLVANNVFAGSPMEALAGRAVEGGNFAVSGGLVNPRVGNFALVRGSVAIDAAVDARSLDPGAPVVDFEYRHPAQGTARPAVWTRDAGAHEFCDSSPSPRPGSELPLLGE